MDPSITQLREDPSGVPIQVNGAPAGMGPGALVRLKEGQKTGTQSITTVDAELLFDGSVGLRVELPNPDPQYHYRAEAEFDVTNLSTGTSTIVAALRASYDNGGTWTVLQTDSYNVQGNSEDHVHPRFVLQALTGLPAAGADSVILDCLVSANPGVDVNGAIARMSIAEHLPTT